MKSRPQVLFLSHGGGPMPLLGDTKHEPMINCLKTIAKNIKKPSAILVISAHWEEKVPTITSGRNPSLTYDYYGLPQASYEIQYPCLGEPKLAERIHTLFNQANIAAAVDPKRGLDHGVFVPLKIMYPDADIPCVQLSLLNSLNPADHLNLGKALQGLEEENLLVIGSGFSFHNMKAFFASPTSESKTRNELFEDWLADTCVKLEMSEDEREQRLVHWENAPFARYCHPREEHLLPLLVCCGLARTASTDYFEVEILNKKSSMYYWSNEH